MKDNPYELFPIVNKEGEFLGTVSRGYAHSGSKILHPVVHLHVFNSKNEIYLQHRPMWEEVQPGKWDTACGGHVSLGEYINDALFREVKEELGITDFSPEFVAKYTYESKTEYELVNVYFCHYDKRIKPNTEELSGGKFWGLDEIQQSIGNGLLTPNFEDEFTNYLLPYLTHHIE